MQPMPPYPVTMPKEEENHALQRQKPPHATLPCTMTGQDRVILSPSTYKYREPKKKKGGGEKKKKIGGKFRQKR